MNPEYYSVSKYTKQRVINYEQSLNQRPCKSLPQHHTNHQAKYTICDLNIKIKQLIQNQPYNLRWIGNGKNARLEAYIYCVLMLSASDPTIIMDFKSVFYEFCQKYLELEEQKLMIQFFGLLENQKDKHTFMKKYPKIQTMILSILNTVLEEQKVRQSIEKENSFDPCLSFNKNAINKMDFEDNFQNGSSFEIEKIAKTYKELSKRFDFIQLKKLNEFSFQLSNQNCQKMYVILEKQYFFVLQILDGTHHLISKKSKLSQGDLNQVQRLLNQGQNCQQKSNQTIKYQPLNEKQSNFKDKEFHSKEKSKDFITIPGIPLKKDNTPQFFASKAIKNHNISNHSSLNLQNQNRQQNANPHQYIDLMESSFQQQKNSDQTLQLSLQKQNFESDSFKFYKPKTFVKIQNSPSFLYFKKKNQNHHQQTTQNAKRTRSPSEFDKKYFTKINNQLKQKERQKSSLIKDFRLNSSLKLIEETPLKLFEISPDKQSKKSPKKQSKVSPLNKCLKKEEFFQQKLNINEKQKTKKIEKKPINIADWIKKAPSNAEKSGRSLQKKINFLPSYSPKVFNNRISLQSRQDLHIFCKPKQLKEPLILKGIDEVDRSLELSKRDLSEKKKMIRDELCQSLNSGSQNQMKKKLFEQFQTKYGEPKICSKRNKSLEDKDTQPSQEMIPPLKIKVDNKQFETQNHQRQNGGYEIRVIFSGNEKTSI